MTNFSVVRGEKINIQIVNVVKRDEMNLTSVKPIVISLVLKGL